MVAAVEGSEPDEDLFAKNPGLSSSTSRRISIFLDAKDRNVLEFTYRSFFDEQLELRFKSHGRPPMPYHPTYRTLLVARDSAGRPAHFLSRPDDYDHVRRLAREGRLVPVVGDFAGPPALRAIGKFAREQGRDRHRLLRLERRVLSMRAASSELRRERPGTPASESSQFIRAYFSYGYPTGASPAIAARCSPEDRPVPRAVRPGAYEGLLGR
jgi:hypothetical protein